MTTPDLGEAGPGPTWTGWRCAGCGCVAFGAATACPRCHDTTGEELGLSHQGVVWTVTVQRFAPKSPPYIEPEGGFRPYAVAYVELAEGIRVEGIVRSDDPGSVRIGHVVELVTARPVPVFALTGAEA